MKKSQLRVSHSTVLPASDESGLPFEFSDQDRTITVYGYLFGTGEYIGRSDCFIPATTGLPALCTHKPVPPVPEGKVAIFDEKQGCWTIVDDFRGVPLYDKRTRQAVSVYTPGELPENVTPLAPSSEFDIWGAEGWEKDMNAEIAARRQGTQAKKNSLMVQAGHRIDVLTDRLNLKMTKDSDATMTLIAEWRKFRVLVDDINPDAENITWPELPDEHL